MAKYCLVLLWVLTSGAKAQPVATNRALERTQAVVRRFYNASQPDSIYALTNKDFRSQIPADDFREFITGASAGLGKWQSSEPPRFVGTVYHYKSIFSNGPMDFLLQLDNQQKISLFALQPYRESAGSASHKTTDLTNNTRKTALDRQVDEAVRAYVTDSRVVGLSIGILRNDSLFTFGYGETAKGSNQTPDGNTLFEIGSVTKTFTSALLADAVRQGRVRLDDAVNKYLPDSIPPLRHNGVDVTLKMLANHTSGLPRLAGNWNTGSAFSTVDPYALYDEQALFNYLKKPVFDHTPGTTYTYSNLAVGLLGTILARQAGITYEQLLTDRITRPLHLNDTKLTLTTADQHRLAQGHNEAGLVVTGWNFRAMAGAGAIRSTTNDLLRYLQANLGAGPADLAETLKMTHQQTFAGQNPVETVGLGWHLVNRTGWWWHNGGTGGFRSFVGFDPAKKTAVVLLANSIAKPLDGLDWKLIKAAGL